MCVLCFLVSFFWCCLDFRIWSLDQRVKSFSFLSFFFFFFTFPHSHFFFSIFSFFCFTLPLVFCLVILPSCCALCYLELLPCCLVLLLQFVVLLCYLIPLPHSAASRCFIALPHCFIASSRCFVTLSCCLFTSLPLPPHLIAIIRCFAHYHRSLPHLIAIVHCFVRYHHLLLHSLLSLPSFHCSCNMIV